MNKQKIVTFGIAMFFVIIFFSQMGCARPFGKTINFDKEMAKLIPVLREDAPLIIDRLEIIRQGLLKGKEYTIYLDSEEDNKMKIEYCRIRPIFNFEEKQEIFSAEQIDAINDLFFSDELQLDAIYIIAYDLYLYTVFSMNNSRCMLGIHYLDPDDPGDAAALNAFRRDGDYVEEVGDNYWIVMWFRSH
jgi:hypothetical protein